MCLIAESIYLCIIKLMLIMKKDQLKRKCIFGCEGKLSKEHIISNWITKEFPNSETHHSAGLLLQDENDKNLYTVDPNSIKQGNVRQVTVRSVCLECNNGWMSTIVNNSKESIRKLVNDEEIILTDEIKRYLASFAVLSCINYEQKELGSTEASVGQEDLAYLKDNLMPSKNWEVWIAKSSHPMFQNSFSGRATVLRRVGSNDTQNNAFDFYMCIDGLVIVVRYNRTHIPYNEIFRNISGALTNIWHLEESEKVFDNKRILSDNNLSDLFHLTRSIPGTIVPAGPNPIDIIEGLFGMKLFGDRK